jgi:hypothetical protein
MPEEARWNVDADVELFRTFKRIRDELFHGLRSDLPHDIDGQQFDNVLLDLVNRYLRNLVLAVGRAGFELLEFDPVPEPLD